MKHKGAIHFLLVRMSVSVLESTTQCNFPRISYILSREERRSSCNYNFIIEGHVTVNHASILPVYQYEEIGSNTYRVNSHNILDGFANTNLSIIHKIYKLLK